jgi:hypothetical protein
VVLPYSSTSDKEQQSSILRPTRHPGMACLFVIPPG